MCNVIKFRILVWNEYFYLLLAEKKKEDKNYYSSQMVKDIVDEFRLPEMTEIKKK